MVTTSPESSHDDDAPTVVTSPARDSHPATSIKQVPAQAGARTGLVLTSRCCAASAGLSCRDTAPQYDHTCFTRFLTGTLKVTWPPLSSGAVRRRGIPSLQPSKRRASAKAAAWCTLSPYRSINFTRPITELYAGFT